MIYPAGIEVKRHILASDISFANLFWRQCESEVRRSRLTSLPTFLSLCQIQVAEPRVRVFCVPGGKTFHAKTAPRRRCQDCLTCAFLFWTEIPPKEGDGSRFQFVAARFLSSLLAR
jgi:hypothetical protein